MHKTIGNAIAILAAVIAIVIVVADRPLIAAIVVACAGALFGTIVRNRGRSSSESVGLR